MRQHKKLQLETLETRLAMSSTGIIAIQGDWDGDGVDSVGLYNPATSQFYLSNENTLGFVDTTFKFGGKNSTLQPVAGDWDGDGIDTVGLYNRVNGNLRIKNDNAAGPSDQVIASLFSTPGGIAVAGDWDGDGIDSLAVHNPANGQILLKNSLSAAAAAEVFAAWPGATSSWKPVAGDFDGDGVDSFGFLKPSDGSVHYKNDLRSSLVSSITAFAPGGTFTLLAGDWDGDGDATFGRYSTQTGVIAINNELVAGPADASFYVVPSTPVSSNAPTAVSSAAVSALAVEATLTAEEVEQLLDRASAASASDDFIIAVVDRGGRILGVRVEDGVNLAGDTLVFAIDGAVAKARAAALFSSGTSTSGSASPITSRTVRFLSQSTVTQREVQSNPNIGDINSPFRGPGFVAPIGVGGHFPPGIRNTPPVDLFRIEHTNRDSIIHPGLDGNKTTVADNITLQSRFNVPTSFIPAGKELGAPESYGYQSGLMPLAQSRGIATLPGGVPLYRNGEIVGGIGVFYPGPDGYATHEQDFVAGTTLAKNNPAEAERRRTNAPKVLEAEWIAFAAAGGSTGFNASVGELGGVARVPGFDLPAGRIDLAGITLEIYAQHPLKTPTPFAQGDVNGTNQVVDPGADNDPSTVGDNLYALDGKAVAHGWLVMPHAAADGSLTADQVRQIIQQGIVEANLVRSQIRVQTPDLTPGARTRMVFAVADKDGNVLGLYRMPDAPVFSLDVAVAKARNTAYYADPADLVKADRVDDNDDGTPDVAKGKAFTNRTFRFLAEPRYPAGVDGSKPGDFSILRDLGINKKTAENVGAARPASVYSTATTTVLAFDAFNIGRNFRDPGDSASALNPFGSVANQNGVVFFPGSTPLYSGKVIVGGFGVSGDGVDQDDVVTFSGSKGYQAPAAARADTVFVRNVRLPFQKFPRNPRA